MIGISAAVVSVLLLTGLELWCTLLGFQCAAGKADIESYVRVPFQDARQVPQAALRQRELKCHSRSSDDLLVALVMMVGKRGEYFREVLRSIRVSDTPCDVPIIVSHDGHFEAMEKVVADFRAETEFDNVVQMYHPSSCSEHQHEFPGDDAPANVGYKGDQYGNPRSPWATCVKHHWWWMMHAVWHQARKTHPLPNGGFRPYDAVVYLEEDFVVGPSFMHVVKSGLAMCPPQHDKGAAQSAEDRANALDKNTHAKRYLPCFGVVLDRPKNGAELRNTRV